MNEHTHYEEQMWSVSSRTDLRLVLKGADYVELNAPARDRATFERGEFDISEMLTLIEENPEISVTTYENLGPDITNVTYVEFTPGFDWEK